VLRRIIFF